MKGEKANIETRGRWSPLIMVLHWNCWALILPVLWLVFLPSRHLFSCFTLLGCVCSKGKKKKLNKKKNIKKRGSCLIKWMFERKKVVDACYCRLITDQWRDSSSLNVYCQHGKVSQICLRFVSVLVILSFPKGCVWRSVCTAVKWYIYNKCKPLRNWCRCVCQSINSTHTHTTPPLGIMVVWIQPVADIKQASGTEPVDWGWLWGFRAASDSSLPCHVVTVPCMSPNPHIQDLLNPTEWPMWLMETLADNVYSEKHGKRFILSSFSSPELVNECHLPCSPWQPDHRRSGNYLFFLFLEYFSHSVSFLFPLCNFFILSSGIIHVI